MPGERAESVFFTTWHALPEAARPDRIDWPALIELRRDVRRELEKLRMAGSIGAPLDAQVDIYCLPTELRALQIAGE